MKQLSKGKDWAALQGARKRLCWVAQMTGSKVTLAVPLPTWSFIEDLIKLVEMTSMGFYWVSPPPYLSTDRHAPVVDWGCHARGSPTPRRTNL